MHTTCVFILDFLTRGAQIDPERSILQFNAVVLGIGSSQLFCRPVALCSFHENLLRSLIRRSASASPCLFTYFPEVALKVEPFYQVEAISQSYSIASDPVTS